MQPGLLQKLERREQAQHLQQRRERDVLLALDDGEQQLRRQHLLLERRHRGIERRQEQAEEQRRIAQDAHAGRRDIIDRAILRRGHQNSKVDRREIAERQPVDQQADLPLEQSLTELIRPLGILQQWKRRPARTGHIFLHRRRGEQPVDVDARKPLFHPCHELRIGQPRDGADRHIRLRPPPDGLARKPQLRRAQMPPDKGRVDPDRFRERILRALDGVLALRRRGAAPRPALGLEAERLGQPRKDHHAVPVRQLVRRGLGRVRLLTHRAPDRAALRLRI